MIPVKRLYQHTLVLCILAALLQGGLVSALQNVLTDFRFRTVQRPATGQIVVVAIDPHSLQEFGVWPWPRRLHANLIQKLREAGVTDIVFDVDLSARSSPADDAAFVAALGQAGGAVVLPLFIQAAAKSEDAFALHLSRALPEFRAHAWEASVNVSAAPDGRIRRYAFGDTLGGEFFPSAAAMLASGTFDNSAVPFYLDFGIRLQEIPVVSFSDVLKGKAAEFLRGKKVIVGGTAIELGDRYLVPNDGIISGPKLHALAAESIVQQRTLAATSNATAAAGTALLILLMFAVDLWRPGSLAARTIALPCLAITIELAATALQASTPIVVHTAIWHWTLLAYMVAGWLSDIDLRSMSAKVSKQQFQCIATSLRDGVICANGQGEVTFCNAAAETIFGCHSKPTLGRTLGEFFKVQSSSGNPIELAKPAELMRLLTQAPGPLEFVGVRTSGETFPLEVSLSAWPDNDGLQYGAVVRDITERKREEEKIRYLALHDSLTGVLNRAGLRAVLSNALADPQRDESVGLVLIDLDDFKHINDTLGHHAGDEVLRQVASYLRDSGAGGATIGRLGGDEFAIVVQGADAASKAVAVAHAAIGELRRSPVNIEGRSVVIRATMGVAIAGPPEQTIDDLLLCADLALYRAKSADRGSLVIYSPELKQGLDQRRTLERELGEAVGRGEFELFYQPQVRLIDKAVVGVEALLRWRHPTRGILAPAQFLDVLNDTSLSSEVGEWVIQTACRQAQLWSQRNRAIRVGVNLAPSQFRSDLTALVERVLVETGLPPALLELEVTENIVLERDGTAMRATLERIRAMGVGVAFDDFGTGYASLTHLRQFPLSRLKIDRSFVRGLQSDEGNAAIVGAVAGLGKRLGISVIAEGIEDEKLLSLLLAAGCEEGQGYLLGKPMPVQMIEDLLDEEQNIMRLVPAAA